MRPRDGRAVRLVKWLLAAGFGALALSVILGAAGAVSAAHVADKAGTWVFIAAITVTCVEILLMKPPGRQ